MLRTGRHVHQQTGLKNLCLAGGVALNCVANGRLQREGPFDNIWIQPGRRRCRGSAGVALLIWHQLLDHPRTVDPLDGQHGSLLGPRFGDDGVREFLEDRGAVYHFIPEEDELCEKVAELIAAGKVVGWMQGRMEFGPRALGCRSIIGDARSAAMQSVMNLKIKFRESFRPFAPSVLSSGLLIIFEMPADENSPYMLLVAPVRTSRRTPPDSDADNLQGLQKLKTVRSEVPAITHVDYSARVQTVDAARNPRYHKLIQAFDRMTGCPVIINTSFNVRGEPIVCSPQDAYHCFMGTHMDVLVVNNFVLFKEEQADTQQIDGSSIWTGSSWTSIPMDDGSVTTRRPGRRHTQRGRSQ